MNNGQWVLDENWQAPRPPDKLSRKKAWQVDALVKFEDFNCVLLAKLGYSVKTIARATKMTQGKVIYRLNKYKTKVTDYRNGKGAYSEMVLHRVTRMGAKMLTNDLRQLEAGSKVVSGPSPTPPTNAPFNPVM